MSYLYQSTGNLLTKLRVLLQNTLRGCDAIYAAVAYMFNAKLITLDKQQCERAAECIEVASPQDELKILNKF